MKTISKLLLLLIVTSSLTDKLNSQHISDFRILTQNGISVSIAVMSDKSEIQFLADKPLFSFLLDNHLLSSQSVNSVFSDNEYIQHFENSLRVTYNSQNSQLNEWEGKLIFENYGKDTLAISNVVPFGEDSSQINITGRGPDDLARAWLSRPGYRPLRVILPDNAWELGYSSFPLTGNYSVSAIARRDKIEGGQKKRYETLLPPGAKVTYLLHACLFSGDWQNGLRMMFRDKYLYDLKKFDNSLYKRKDLAWIKESYLIILQMAWDREFYDRITAEYTFPGFLKSANTLFGGLDVYGIWPTWPRLGLDEENQWDMYRNLPGGIGQLKNFVQLSRQSGTKFFIAYNPWDNSTRKEDHFRGIARLISEIDADGVVLDTRGSSSYELQAAADSVRKGVIMYSEGMAVARDMPGIIAGRVHNAIFLSPELNLNKLIKPDFSIFRVCDVGEDNIHREIAISFFNGYGTELNMFRPGGRDDQYRNDMQFLSSTTFILRQNNDAFLDNDWTPLIPTLVDNVFVNRWKSGDKTVYTILNMRPGGTEGKLFRIDKTSGKHYLSLWSHENLTPEVEDGKLYITSKTTGWHESYAGSRMEGSVDCIAEFPVILNSQISGDSIKVGSSVQGKLLIWKGNPSVNTEMKELSLVRDTTFRIKDIFGIYEGKIVLQLIENKRLKDENILTIKGGKPWKISRMVKTIPVSTIPNGMVLIPANTISYKLTTDDEFIPYASLQAVNIKVDSFLIDRYPVTNAQYYQFIVNSGYIPADTTRYLRNWNNGTFRQGQDKYPVVYVSYEDMQAYARWSGKRLPSEVEWQLAAQGSDGRRWPWGNEFHAKYCNNSSGRPTPVDAFPKGQSQYGVSDLVGNVWQTTGDLYFNGSNYLSIIRGGSYYKPESSWWYIQGGPQPLDKTQMLLMVSPGFDRSSTVGFRCVKDFVKK